VPRPAETFSLKKFSRRLKIFLYRCAWAA